MENENLGIDVKDIIPGFGNIPLVMEIERTSKKEISRKRLRYNKEPNIKKINDILIMMEHLII